MAAGDSKGSADILTYGPNLEAVAIAKGKKRHQYLRIQKKSSYFAADLAFSDAHSENEN